MKTEFTSVFVRLLLVAIILYFLHPSVQDNRLSVGLNYARYYFQIGQPEAAEIQLKSVQYVEPWRVLPWSDLASKYLEQGKSDRTISILEPLSRENNLNSNAWLTLAKGYEQIELPSRVEESLLSLLELKETGSETITAYQMLIKLYRSQDRFEESLTRQSELSKIAPDTQNFVFEKNILMLALHPLEGLQEWKSITGKPIWLVQLGNQISLAMQEENEPLRMVEIGRAFGGIAQWDLAEYWLQQAVEISPKYAEAWAFLAEARQERGSDGKEQINYALEIAPTSHGVRALAAIYFRRQREFSRAIALIQQNIADQPTESVWYMELGSTLAETGKMEDAASAYQKAVQLSPSDFTKQMAIARFCVQYDYRVSDLGLPAAEKAVELAAESAEAQDIYGLILMSLGDSKKATLAFSVALSLNPDYAPTWLHIGQEALSENNSTLAKEALIKTVEISGNSSEAQIASRLLKQYYSINMDSLNN